MSFSEDIKRIRRKAFMTQEDFAKEIGVSLFDRVSELFNSENLNSEYYKDDVQIGHTYFLVTSVEQLYLRFRYQIIPILREYYKDGMFQLETPETDTDGWYGLLGCINGTVDINAEEDRVKDIFEKAHYHSNLRFRDMLH
jgi:transcriptional regulator with XRE-family HTH domain